MQSESSMQNTSSTRRLLNRTSSPRLCDSDFTLGVARPEQMADGPLRPIAFRTSGREERSDNISPSLVKLPYLQRFSILAESLLPKLLR